MLTVRADPHAAEIRGSPPPDGDEPSLRAIWLVLYRHRLLIAASILTALALGIAYTLYSRPVYESVSVVRFETERLELPQLVQLPSTANLITTEIEVLRGRNAAQAAIDSLGLRARLVAPRHGRRSELFSHVRVAAAVDSGTLVFRARPDSTFVISRPDEQTVLASARAGDTVAVAQARFVLTPRALDEPELRLRIDLEDDAIERFQNGLRVSRPTRDADLIAIRVRANDPEEAAATANLLAHNVVAGRQAFRRSRTDVAATFLQEQAGTLRQQLRKAEDDLRAYREREHVVDASQQSRSQVTRLADLQAELAQIRAERDAFATLLAQLRSDTGGTLGGQAASRRLMAFPSLLRNQSASVLLGELAEIENRRSELLIRRVPGDSDVQVLTGRIREIETQLQGIAESYLQSLSNQVASLEGEARLFAAQLDAMPAKELETARREREARVLNDLWVLVQTRLKEAEITGAVVDPTARVVDRAATPLRPVRPRPLVNIALSLMAGVLIGVGAAFAREHEDRSVRSRADALAAGGLPVLGAIPRVDHRGLPILGWRRHDARDRLVGSGNGDSGVRDHRVEPKGDRAAATLSSLLVTAPTASTAHAESYNQLFANLALTHRQQPLKVIVFTSPLPAEGKTLSAINFALTGASRGLRVLLVDADLRCGVVHSVLGCRRTPGLAELLSGATELEQASRRVVVGENTVLTVVPTGALPKVPARILAVDKVHQLLAELTPQFDFVVIDTPPVNLLADAALLGSAADGVILVVRAGHTQVNDLRYAMEQLAATKAPVIGTLLNDVDLRHNARDDGAYRYLLATERYHVGAD
jgi:polysaccharide biosynthesis transport protein